MANKKRGLGKGLGALIPDYEKDENKAEEDIEKSVTSTSKVPVKKIRINPWQPRKEFDPEALNELAQSIKTHGIIQPLTVRRKNDHFELISGERRLRAVKIIGLKEIEVFIREDVDDEQMLQMAIIENLQREDLNAIEVATGYKRLKDEFNYSQEEIAKKVGKNRTTVTNFLRLLNLPDVVQKSLINNEITSGHARALLSLEEVEKIVAAWKIIRDENLSVREAEQLVKNYSNRKKKKQKKSDNLTPELKAIIEDTEDQLRNRFGTAVKIKFGNDEKGKIEIDYYSKDDLNRILEILGD